MPTSNHPTSRAQRPFPTILLSALFLALGIPLAVAALIFERVYVPNVILGTKTIKAGLDTTKTISFSLLTGPNDAVMAASYISIICSIVLVGGLWLVRHVSTNKVWGWVLVGPAIVDVLGQIACLAYVFIVNGSHAQASSADQVQFVDGHFDTNGTLYTKEAWACMMERFYPELEGSWAKTACSDLKVGRTLTIPLTLGALVLVALSFWQVQRRGGLRWLLHGRGRVDGKIEPIGL